MFYDFNVMNNIREIISEGARAAMSETQFIASEIKRWKNSPLRKLMLDAERYYVGDHDILMAERQVIGEDGMLKTVENLPNNHVIDNQYKKMVKQKTNYLLGKPITYRSDNDAYADAVTKLLGRQFMRTVKNMGRDSINDGIAWLYPYYNEAGELEFKRFKGYEMIPEWQDIEHTKFDFVIRLYQVIEYEGANPKVTEKVEVYKMDGVYNYTVNSAGDIVPDQEPFHPYIEVDDTAYQWDRIPLIPFKYNDDELPLIKGLKSLQDGINKILSTFENNMEEDTRNTILVLVNYDGQNLGEFRRNLAQFGAVKIKTTDGVAGDVRTLQIQVNAENYKAILEVFKKAIIENAMGYDAKDDRLGSNANQMNIQSMYNDIDLDANEMETEYQAGFEQLMWFINCHLANTGQGDFFNEHIDVIFNRDMMMNEADIINNARNSLEILSRETVVANHPWVTDPTAELEKIEQEKQENIEQYGLAFGGRQDEESEEDEE